MRGHRREPLPILNCGMACQFNSGELCPLDQLEPYIQDALDLVEFANGPSDSTWGAKRAAMGHPEPFNLKMMGVGNEQWGPQYIERYTRFAKAIKEKYPEIKLVSDVRPVARRRPLSISLVPVARAARGHRGRTLLRQPFLVLPTTLIATTITTATAPRFSWANTPRKAWPWSAPRIATIWNARWPRPLT